MKTSIPTTIKSPVVKSTSSSKLNHLKSLSHSIKPNLSTPYLNVISPENTKALHTSPDSKARFVSFKDIHGNPNIPLISEEASSIKDSSPGSRTSKMRGSPTFTPQKKDEVSFSPKKKISLPQLSSRLTHRNFDSPDIVKTEGNEEAPLSFRTNVSSWDANTSSDYIKQSEFLNTSPHFSKFSQLSNMLSKIEAKKSSLSKELFYYPEQIEAHKKLSLQASLILKNRDDDSDMGIISISENTKHEVNLLEGRNAYFKLNCQNKHFPLRVKVDVYLGSFEIRISKTKKKPSLGQYDHLFSVSHFEVEYDNPQEVKYLYFGIHGLERLRLIFGVAFTPKPKMPYTLSPLAFDQERYKKRNKAYEFFSKDMRPEEVDNLRRVVEDIREEKQQKALALTKNVDIKQLNQILACKYDMFRAEQMASFAQKRELRYHQNQISRETQIIDKQKKMLCEKYRGDIMKIRHQWEIDEAERLKILQETQKVFSVIITFFSICKELGDKRVAIRIVKMIKKSIELKVLGIQKAFRAHINRPITIVERLGPQALTVPEAKGTIDIYHALNAWALNKRRTVMKKAPALINKFCEELLEPIGILEAVKKYSEKVSLVQEKWKARKQLTNAKLDVFIIYWERYCVEMVVHEKNKIKKQQTHMLLKQISDEQIRKHGQDFFKNKIKALVKARNFFLTVQTSKTAPKSSKPNSKGQAEETNHKLAPKLNSKGSIANEGEEQVQDSRSKTDLDDMILKISAKPTSDELKSVFDKILAELKSENKI